MNTCPCLHQQPGPESIFAPVEGERLTNPGQSVYYINDVNLPFNEVIFWMLPGCNNANSYDFGGVCKEEKLPPTAISEFELENRSLVIPGKVYNVEGVVLARVNWTPFTISAVFAKKGTKWLGTEFIHWWRYHPKPPKPWELVSIPWSTPIQTFTVGRFREISRSGELFDIMKNSVRW